MWIFCFYYIYLEDILSENKELLKLMVRDSNGNLDKEAVTIIVSKKLWKRGKKSVKGSLNMFNKINNSIALMYSGKEGSWLDSLILFPSAVDIISAIEFDKSGDHLATGDRGGRVVLFERTDTKDVCFLLTLRSIYWSTRYYVIAYCYLIYFFFCLVAAL